MTTLVRITSLFTFSALASAAACGGSAASGDDPNSKGGADGQGGSPTGGVLMAGGTQTTGGGRPSASGGSPSTSAGSGGTGVSSGGARACDGAGVGAAGHVSKSSVGTRCYLVDSAASSAGCLAPDDASLVSRLRTQEITSCGFVPEFVIESLPSVAWPPECTELSQCCATLQSGRDRDDCVEPLLGRGLAAPEYCAQVLARYRGEGLCADAGGAGGMSGAGGASGDAGGAGGSAGRADGTEPASVLSACCYEVCGHTHCI